MDVRGEVTDAAVEAALTKPHERQIIAACIRRARAARDLAEMTRIPTASLYRHIHRLIEAHLLVVERSALTEDGKPYDLYRSRIRSARLEVAAEKIVVRWEPNEAVEDRLFSMWERLRD